VVVVEVRAGQTLAVNRFTAAAAEVTVTVVVHLEEGLQFMAGTVAQDRRQETDQTALLRAVVVAGRKQVRKQAQAHEANAVSGAKYDV